MKVRLLGLRTLDFTSDDGQKINGTKLYIAFPDANVTGEMVADHFIRDGAIALPSMKPGDVIDIDYNNRGKPVGLTVITSK